VINMLYILD
jgi:hypothetical protein